MEIKQWRCLAAQCTGFLMLVLLLCALSMAYGSGKWRVMAQQTREDRDGESQAKDMTEYETEERKRQLELLRDLQEGQAGEEKTDSEPEEEDTPVVVIDAGHGGMDEGTMSVDEVFSEKDVSLQVVFYLKELLDQSGLKVFYTRLEDTEVTKAKRVKLANRVKADAFVSIHCNASEPGDTTAYGMEALYTRRRQASSETLSSKALASEILKQTSIYTGRRKRGIIRREDLYLMRHSQVPVTIIEIGYMTNSSELKYLLEEKKQRQVAEGIYLGIRQSLSQNGRAGKGGSRKK